MYYFKIILLFVLMFIGSHPVHAFELSDLKKVISEHRVSEEYLKEGYPLITYAISRGYRDISLHLAKNGRDPNGYTKDKRTSSLCLAIYQEDSELVHTLLLAGADPNGIVTSQINSEGKMVGTGDTPLDSAIRLNEKTSVAQLLLEFGANPNFDHAGTAFYDKRGTLWIAADQGSLEKFELLLNFDANPHTRHGNPRDVNYIISPLCSVAYEIRPEFRKDKLIILERLLNLGIDPNPHALASAVNSRWPEAVELLIHYGADAHETWGTKPHLKSTMLGTLAATVVTCTSDMDEKEIVKALVTEGVDVNERSCFTHGKMHIPSAPPILIALSKNKFCLVKTLLECGASLDFLVNCDATAQNGLTPLLFCIVIKNEKAARFLVSHGVDPEDGGRSKYNPLDLAISSGLNELAEELIQAIAEKYL